MTHLRNEGARSVFARSPCAAYRNGDTSELARDNLEFLYLAKLRRNRHYA